MRVYGNFRQITTHQREIMGLADLPYLPDCPGSLQIAQTATKRVARIRRVDDQTFRLYFFDNPPNQTWLRIFRVYFQSLSHGSPADRFR